LIFREKMSTAVKNKGGMKAWATDEQKAWLTKNITAYVAAKTSQLLSDFWAPTFEDWFERWPIVEPTGQGDEVEGEAMKKKKQVSSFGPTSNVMTHSCCSKSKSGLKTIVGPAPPAGVEGVQPLISVERSRQRSCPHGRSTRNFTTNLG
jgi:hypothetical protein